MPSLANGFAAGLGVGVGVPFGVGDAVGVGVGVKDGVGDGDGVGVGAVNELPSKDPGFVGFGVVGLDVVAFELNAIHFPSLLMTGRVFIISTRTFENIAPDTLGSNKTLFVSVI